MTKMNYMFHTATAFNQDISNWDTHNVTTMNNMFNGATSFDQNIGNWNVTNVSDMTSMFTSVTLSTYNYDKLLMHLLPEKYQKIEPDLYGRILGVCSFIAGMSDGAAILLHKKIKGIEI